MAVFEYVNKMKKQSASNSIQKEGSPMYKEILAKLTNRQELNESEIFELIAAINHDEVSGGANGGGFQVALLMKSPTLKGNPLSIAQAMRENCVQIRPKSKGTADGYQRYRRRAQHV